MSWTTRPSLPALHKVTATEYSAILDRIDLNTYNLNTGAAFGTVSTTTTYANMPGTSSIANVVKKQGATVTALEIDATVDFYSTAASTVVAVGVLINGVDYDLIGSYSFNAANDHRLLGGRKILASGALAAGTYTVQLRWKRLSGAGTLTIAGADSWYSMTVREVWL